MNFNNLTFFNALFCWHKKSSINFFKKIVAKKGSATGKESIKNRRGHYVIIYGYISRIFLYSIFWILFILLFTFNRKKFYSHINTGDKISGSFMHGHVANLMIWIKITVSGVCCWFFFTICRKSLHIKVNKKFLTINFE